MQAGALVRQFFGAEGMWAVDHGSLSATGVVWTIGATAGDLRPAENRGAAP